VGGEKRKKTRDAKKLKKSARKAERSVEIAFGSLALTKMEV